MKRLVESEDHTKEAMKTMAGFADSFASYDKSIGALNRSFKIMDDFNKRFMSMNKEI